MKTTALIGLMSLSLAGSAIAMGGRSDGGGASVVCRDSQNRITSARFFDLYAAENDGKRPLTIIRSDAPVEAQLQAALERWKNKKSPFMAWDDETPFDVSLMRRALALVKRDWVPLRKGTRLPFVPDVQPDFLPTNPRCKLETTAHYDDSTNTLYVDMDIYSHLSPTDQAALKLHEATYKIDRVLSNATNSKETRKTVALLFSKEMVSNPKMAEPYFDSGLISLNSDGPETQLTLQKMDLFLGGKSLYCESATNPKDFIAFKFLPNSRDLTDESLYLSVTDDSTLGWEGPTESTVSLQRLKSPGLTGLYEDWGVIKYHGADDYSLSFQYLKMLTDDVYLNGKMVDGNYTYINERDVDNVPHLPLRCGLR